MLATDCVEKTKIHPVERDFCDKDDVICGSRHSPGHFQTASSPCSPSPPPPPPPVSGRWSDFGSFRRTLHGRMPTTNSGLSYSESDSCPQCRERYSAFKRSSSIQSAATLNSYTGTSSQTRKGNNLLRVCVCVDFWKKSLDKIKKMF